MSLVEFMRARLDEREQRIREFIAYRKRLQDEDGTADGGWDLWGEFGRLVDSLITPDDWLAEVDAKRRIIDEHFGFLHPAGNPDRACRRCSDLRADDDPLIHMDRWIKLQPAPCTTLRLLALPYASRPDYRDEWKP